MVSRSAGCGRESGKPSVSGSLTSRQIWEHAWSTARFHLGLSDQEFFRLTPRQLKLLKDRRNEEHERQELLMGILASTVATVMGGSETRLTPGDFMPSQRTEKALAERKRREQERATEQFRAMMQDLMAQHNKPNG